jgi:hypothetical protein
MRLQEQRGLETRAVFWLILEYDNIYYVKYISGL